MSKNKIFFSYSRDNSEFVLNLAKDLRLAGADIWLDQLDIKPGTRWDKSIEKALADSNTLLVILSKGSVESTNVMDEVSFALEENMIVVPVLLETCDIPFRLRRLQYADFSKDHKKGIKALIQTLGLEQNVASKLVDVAASHNSNVTAEETKKAEQIKKEIQNKKEAAARTNPITHTKPTHPQPTPNPSKNNILYYIIGGIGLIIGVLFFSGVFPFGQKNDKRKIRKAKIEKVNSILKADSVKKVDSVKKINRLKKLDFIKKVNSIKRLDSIKEMDSIKQQDSIKISIPEPTPSTPISNIYDADWAFAERTSSIDEYLNYMKKYGSVNAHFDEANKAIDVFLEKEGFIQYKESNGNLLFQKYFWKDTNGKFSFEEDNKNPDKNDIVIAKQARNVRKGVIGIHSNSARNGDVIKIDEKVRVIDVIKSGNSIWVKILYSK